MLGIIDNDQLSEYHHNWVEEVLKNGSNQRDAKWAESIAVGDKEFVSYNYRRFKIIFTAKRDEIPKPLVGLDGIYALKRLTLGIIISSEKPNYCHGCRNHWIPTPSKPNKIANIS